MPEDLTQIRTRLEAIEQQLLTGANGPAFQPAGLHPGQEPAARNLVQYLHLRSMDIRDLQDELHRHGLSSLASAESHIQCQLEAVLQRLGKEYPQPSGCTADISRSAINRRAELLFGGKRDPDIPYIMVTFDTSFAHNGQLVEDLLIHGMNVARINCAHDDERVWATMIRSVKKAVEATRLECRIYMDLAGPKIRTVILGKGKKKKKVKIEENEHILLTESSARIDKDATVIGCTLPGMVRYLEKGHRVLFDDGAIEAVVEQAGEETAGLRISRISAAKPALKAEKGMNFPDTSIGMIGLTAYDRSCLPFVLEHADLVGYSFVETAAGLADLQDLLPPVAGKGPYIILKIERAAAVENLPELLLQGMTRDAFGIMIARGDLAIEIGFERLSEIQEEILWLSEAAHVPVIWATQVLESMNKTGLATRSEVTDAAYSAFAECVMVNKGSHVLDVLDILRDILRRSGGHHIKKRYSFRPLHIARNFLDRHR
ncbi:MAG TPA: pyruvate kinase [Puia sp.]|nr:pyruvate kinase [Puia sp.]